MAGRPTATVEINPPTTPPVEARRPRRMAALRHYNFSLFLSAAIISNSGTWMQIVAQGYLVYSLTHSPFYLGLVGFAKAVPMIILPPMGGVVADRLPRLKLLKVTQSASLVLAAILGVLVATGIVQVWHIVLLSFVGGLVNAFDSPTQQALVPNLVPREDLTGAIALNSASWQGSALFGPSLAGLTVVAFGLTWAFFINAVSYLAVVIALFLLRDVPEHSGATRHRGLFDDLREGLRYVRGTRLVFVLLFLAGTASIFGRSYQQLLPAFAGGVLHVGPLGLGLMQSAPGGGAIVGAAIVAMASGIERKGRLMLAAMFGFSGTLILLSLSHNLLFSLGTLFLAGVSWIVFSTMLMTMLQLDVPGAMRGRVMSLLTVTIQGFNPLGALIIGSLAAMIGTPQATILGALVVAGVALFAVMGAPVVRRYPAGSATT